MNCWKSINLEKEYGRQWLKYISFLISLLTFITLYVPFSIIHGETNTNDSGIVYFIIALITLPILHTLSHMMPLIIAKKPVKMVFHKNRNRTPVLTYCTNAHISKTMSLLVAIAPTFFITLPGIMMSWLVVDYYVYTLILTSIHVGMTYVDFLYIHHIAKAPKKSFVENGNNGFDILLKESS
ncbi:DUF3267 domain-containing protein [Ornithinibacillus halophilus]|uniref:Putative zincin peptidase n=1 Tax=Ornithinibacillus halophilus TaxID=930117 RepID=A0A1M5LPG9_9BACI|nr:DUF3267 domain-containing protein [Ornithinibacillus halophilus]SHG66856.1 Putative zincin peptidase [Ornithinibacillus halophilus]